MRGPRSSSKVTAAYEDASGTVTQGGPSRSSVGAGGEESAGDESGNLKGLLMGKTGAGAAGAGGKKKGAAKPGHAQDGVLIVERGKALEDEYLLGQQVKAGVDPYAYEGLEDGDDDCPWTEPQESKAKTWRAVQTFEKGRASVRRTGTEEMVNLGPGNVMYFIMLKQMAVTFGIMSLVAVPLFIFANTGNGVIDNDDLGFNHLTLGNAGLRPQYSFNASLLIFPLAGGVPVQIPPKMHTSFFGVSLSHVNMARLIGAEDIVNSLVFLVFALVFIWTHRLVIQRSNDSTCITSGYSVFVRGLPIDATEGEIRRHFSDLFQLSDPDWEFGGFFLGCCCRKRSRLPQDMEDSGELPNSGDVISQSDPVDPCMPVADVSNTQDDSYLGSWACEVSVIHQDAKAVQAFLRRRSLHEKLRRVRAIAKKYSVDTPLKAGPNLRKKLSALRRVEYYEKRMNLLRGKVGGTDLKCIGAFVVFNNEESALRCVHDYRRSSGFLGRLLQPTPLRFRATHRLIVTRAPEPQEVLWENLETPAISRALRALVAWLGMGVLMAISIVIAYLTMRQAGTAGEHKVVPPAVVCNNHLPAVWYDQYLTTPNVRIVRRGGGYPMCADNAATTYLYYNVTDVEDYAFRESSLIEAQVLPLPLNMSETLKVIDDRLDPEFLRFNDVNNVTGGLRPFPTSACYGPCLNLKIGTSPTECRPLACTRPGWQKLGFPCSPTTFYPNVLRDCFCNQELQDSIAKYGLVVGAISAAKSPNKDICTAYIFNYFWNIALPYIGMAALTLFNHVICAFATRLSAFQRPWDLGSQRASVLVKSFVCQAASMSLVILFVFYKRPGGGKLQSLIPGVDDGLYSSFESKWYSIPGFYIVFTLLVNTFLPHIVPLGHWLIIKPCKRRALTTSAPTQMELNRLHEGPVFDTPNRYGSALAVAWVALLFYSGLPLLLPIAAVSMIVQFWLDKLLLLRFNSRPKFYTDALSSLVVSIVPWGVVCHLVMALWILGNKGVLNSGPLDLSQFGLSRNETQKAVDSFIEHTKAYDPLQVARAIVLSHVFPVAVFLLIVVICYVLVLTIGDLLIRAARYFVVLITCGWCCKKITLPRDRRFVPPFTGTFVRELNPRDEYELLHDEVLDGWVLETDAKSHQTLTKVWLADGVVHGVRHAKGDRKRTWEVLRDESLHSYVLTNNPVYKKALSGRAPTMVMSRGKRVPPRSIVEAV